MGKMINWSMKDTNGCVQRGQMFLSQLPKILLSFENSAAETLRRTGADHVLYAVKIYNTADELTAVQFYMNPMSDEEFSKVAGKGRGTMIYGGIKFLAESDHEEGYDGCRWEDVNIDCESETLKELALYPGEPEAYCYIDSTEGEYLPICGGCWYYTSDAGVFYVNLDNPRTNAYGDIGFRSAYFRKLKTE